MAIDKSRTPVWMKVVIVFIAFTFVVGIGFSSFLGSCSSQTPTGTTSTTAGSTSTTQSIQAIGLQFTPVIQAAEASLTADPKNYDLLIAQATNYYDWGQQLQQALGQSNAGQDAPIWKSAASLYARALAVKPGDKQVMGDYAVALHYSGDTPAAIVAGEKLRTLDPKFAPNLFNLGIFYATSGDNVKAKAAFEAYLAVEPTGQDAQAAKDNIASLGK
jgi:tetratricopeptide (TPR) repeat protein